MSDDKQQERKCLLTGEENDKPRPCLSKYPQQLPLVEVCLECALHFLCGEEGAVASKLVRKKLSFEVAVAVHEYFKSFHEIKERAIEAYHNLLREQSKYEMVQNEWKDVENALKKKFNEDKRNNQIV